MGLPLPLAQILLFLKVRNALRVMVIVGFYGCVAMALAKWAWANHAAVHMPSYVALMTFLGIVAIAGGILLRIGRCPRCGSVFAVRADRKLTNNFTSACLNCGLRLDGSNAAER
jgi:uncharacterized membrane protein